MPRFAANLSMMFNEWEFLDRFKAAADAGFDAVEYLFPYDFSPDAIADALARNKLTQAIFNLPAGDWAKGDRGLAALPERAKEFRDSVPTALRYAEATGAKLLHVMSGNAPAGAPASEAIYRENLRLACDAAAPHGITIVIEPINTRDVPGYFMSDFGKATGLIKELQHPQLKLQYDIYHRQILHGDVIRGLEALMPITAHIQIASVPGRNEPGTGELNDLRVFETIDRLGYTGFIGCEYRPAAGTVAGLGWYKPRA